MLKLNEGKNQHVDDTHQLYAAILHHFNNIHSNHNN